MAQNFLACDREQELLLPPSLREWLPEGHLAWFVIDAVRAAEARPVPKSRVERLREGKRRLEEEHEVHCHANEAYRRTARVV